MVAPAEESSVYKMSMEDARAQRSTSRSEEIDLWLGIGVKIAYLITLLVRAAEEVSSSYFICPKERVPCVILLIDVNVLDRRFFFACNIDQSFNHYEESRAC